MPLALGADDTTTHPIIHLPIFEPDDQRSFSRVHQASALSTLLQEGWRLAYTDGSGNEGHTGSGCFSQDRKGNPERETGRYLGNKSTAYDGELTGIALAVEDHDSASLLVVTDSRAALARTVALSEGAPPQSGAERDIKKGLAARTARTALDTAITWVRAHIGLSGNEKADRLARHHSMTGRLRGAINTVTPGGLRSWGKEVRQKERVQPGWGNHSGWNRHALSAYTWVRTNKGPVNSWLHRVKVSETPFCPTCPETIQDGDHVTWTCPEHHTARKALLLGRTTWIELDQRIMIKEEGMEEDQA